MPAGRKITLPIIFILLVILIGGGLFFLASYLLPGLFESKLISILKKNAGISEFSLDFRQLDLKGADLGPLRLGSPQNPAVIVRSVQVDYAAGELYRKKIKKIAASGVELYVEQKNGQWGLRGFDVNQLLSPFNATPAKDGLSGNDARSFPDHIEINNGILIWATEETTFRLAFEIDMVPHESIDHILVATVRLYPRGLSVNAVANIDLKQNQIKAEFRAAKLEFLRFADVFQRIEGLTLRGAASLAADARLRLKPFEVLSFNGRLEGSKMGIAYKGFEFQTASNAPQQSLPLAIDLERHNPGKIDVRLSNLALRTPLSARLSDFGITLQSTETGTEFSGKFRVSAAVTDDPAKSAAGLRFAQPFTLALKFSGHLARDHQWRLELKSEDRKILGQKQMAFHYHQNRISAQIPSVDLSAQGAGRFFDMTYTLQAAAVEVASESVNILSPRLVFTGETNIKADTARGGMSTFNLDLSGSVVTAASATIRPKRLSAGGRLVRDRKGNHRISGRLKFADTRFEANPANIVLHGAQGSIPFKFPAAISGQKGMISIKNTRFNQLDFGSVQAEVQQTASGLAFSGKMKNPVLPALAVQFSGTSDFKHADGIQTRARFTISYPPTAPEIDLGKFLPAAQGFTFSGHLREQGDIVIGKNGWQATAKSDMQNGTLRHRKNKIAVTGIQTELLIQDLANVRSAPGQKLQFAHASLGDINIDNGEIHYQIESAQSFLIEKSHFMWSDGNVDAPAIRFKPGIDDYQLILYCDRLNLAKVLEQFGAASVEAEGELNGRIPIQIKNRQLSFKDGFLFTTPGQPGKIRMKDSEILTAGVPKDSPQYVQMELAREALKDYDYTWAKLNLTTEGEDLVLNMQLDGKPAQSLPFVYQKDIGGFAKVEADVQ
ncbi:MAG: YdbH domain-containing protein, partial [Desulfobacterales bacterium]